MVRNANNIGASGNFNLVLDLARAPLFKWAAYDDLCEPALLEACVAWLDRDPDLLLAYPQTVMIDASGVPIDVYPDALDLLAPDPIARYRDYHAKFRRMGLVNVLYGVVRTEVLRQTPGIAPYANSDVVLIGELALRGRIGQVAQPLFLRRDHPMMTVRAYPSVRDRAQYLDPARRTSNHPYLRMTREHVGVVRRVPLRGTQRLRAYAQIRAVRRIPRAGVRRGSSAQRGREIPPRTRRPPDDASLCGDCTADFPTAVQLGHQRGRVCIHDRSMGGAERGGAIVT